MKVIRMKNKKLNIKSNQELGVSKMEALKQQNKNIESGHLIRQSMKYRHSDIRRWCKQKRRWLTEEQKKQFGLREWHNPNFKSSAKSHKIISGQQLDDYINKSIPTTKEFKEDFKIVWVRKKLFNWIETIYHPTVFMTIQLPNHLKTENMEIVQERIRSVMAYFERQLLGRDWHKYHLPFICFMESGKNGFWHAHILFNQGKFKPWHLWLAADNTLRDFGWSDYCINLDIMNADKKRVISYCYKEIKINMNGHFDSTRLILSDELFKFDINKSKT